MKTNHPPKKQGVFLKVSTIIMAGFIIFSSFGAVYAATPTPTSSLIATRIESSVTRLFLYAPVTSGTFSVTLKDANSGAGIPGKAISWSATAYISFINTSPSITDSQGVAKVQYRIAEAGMGIFTGTLKASFAGDTVYAGSNWQMPFSVQMQPTPPQRITPRPTQRRATVTPTPTAVVTPTPTGAVTVYVGIQNTGEEPGNSCIIDLSPVSLEGTSRIVGGFASGTTKTYPVTYLRNTLVTFTASTVDRTVFRYWTVGGTRYNQNSVTVTVLGGEQVTATFWADFPTPVRRVTITPTPRPTPTQAPTVTPTVTPTATPTPTVPVTLIPTIYPNYIISYTIQSDWGNGATVSVTIKNNTASPLNGWTLAWTFPGNQTITNLWNGVCTQSGTAVSVKDAGFNANIPANGGSVNFGFNLSYSGTNAKPTSFTLNGTACQVQ